MSKDYEYNMGDFVGRGKNKTEAREDAERRVWDATDSHHNPVTVIRWRNEMAVLSCDIRGEWGYRLVNLNNFPRPEDSVIPVSPNTFGFKDYREAKAAAAWHLVQNNHELGQHDLLGEEVAMLEAARVPEDRIEELRRWCAWQSYFDHAYRKHGLNATYARDYADYCKNTEVVTVQNWLNVSLL